MAIKKIITTDLFNKYVNEQIKPYIDDSSAVVKAQLDQEVNDRIDGDNLKIDLLGNEAWSHQPYHFPYHLALNPTADNLVAKAFTITLDNNKTLTQYDFTLPAATTTTAGIMTAADKAKLDDCAPGNYVTLGTEQTITGQKTFTQTIKGTAIQDKDDATLNATFADICDAVDVVGNFQTRKDYSPDEEGQIELPAENVKFTLQSFTAKGIADTRDNVEIEADLTHWHCGNRMLPILTGAPDITLYKTGLLTHMGDNSGRYAYDSVNFETRKIDRYTMKLSLWDIFKTDKYVSTDWGWSNTGGQTGSKGAMTITHTKMNELWGTYAPDLEESELIVNFGFATHFVGQFSTDSEYDNHMNVKTANNTTLSIEGFKDRAEEMPGSGKTGVIQFITAHEEDAKASYIIFKRQTMLEESLPVEAVINATFRGDTTDNTYIGDIEDGIVKVGFLSVADKFYTKAQIDEEFTTKASFNNKELITKLEETEASSSLYGDLFDLGNIVYANFTSSDDTTPFIGHTLFIRSKNNGTNTTWLVISRGSLYQWTGSDTTQPNKIIQPYAARTGIYTLSIAGWSSSQQTLNLTTQYGISLGDNDVLSITPASGSEQAYIDAGITRTLSGSTVTFTAETVPTQAININIVYQKGEPLQVTFNPNDIEQINLDDLDA